MYRKESEGWLKHYDFVLLDMICLQLAFILAYAISGQGWNPYSKLIYRNIAIFIELADAVALFSLDTLKSVLKRGYYQEFRKTIYNGVCGSYGDCLSVSAASVTELFKNGPDPADHSVYRYQLLRAACLEGLFNRKNEKRRRRPFSYDCNDERYRGIRCSKYEEPQLCQIYDQRHRSDRLRYGWK